MRDHFAPRIIGPLLTPVEKCEGCLAQLNFDAYSDVPRFTSPVEAERPRAAAMNAAFVLAIFAFVLLVVLAIIFRRKSKP